MLSKMPIIMSKVLLQLNSKEKGGGGRQMQNMTPYSREKQQLRIQSMATHKPSFIKSISKYTKA